MFESLFTMTFQVLALLSPATDIPETSAMPVDQVIESAMFARPEDSQQNRRLNLIVAPTGNEARYRVREQLAGIDFPNDAIGKTDKISGGLVLESNGRIVKEGSKFIVDLTSLASDRAARDNYVRNNTLQTAQFPTAEFVPTSTSGLTVALPSTADLSFKLVGDFTVHGVTRPATWDVKGKMLSSGEFVGTAVTAFKFGDYGMTVPRARIVMSVVDSITIELDLRLAPATSVPAGGLF